MKITKIADVKPLVTFGRRDPAAVTEELERLAASPDWQAREVAATALVEIGKRQPTAVLALARRWARAADPNLKRAASEGLRGLVKAEPESVREVLELLRAAPELYVRKSVANVLRNASARHPDFVLGLCRNWSRSSDPNTHWIIRDGLRKLAASRRVEVAAILRTLVAVRPDRPGKSAP